MHLEGQGRQAGYALAAVLISVAIMSIVMTALLPVWRQQMQREKEAELVFRGEQYARAIAFFQRQYGNANPPTIDVLVKEKFLRKKYRDPITGDDFALITPTTALPGLAVPPQLRGRGGSARGGSTTRSGSTSGRGGSTSARGSTRGRGSATASGGRSSDDGPRRYEVTFRGNQAGATSGATGGNMGVMSKSTQESLRVYNGGEHYNEWIFMGTQASNRAGAPSGSQSPGVDGGRGQSPTSRGRGGATTQRGGGRRGAGASPGRGRSPERGTTTRRF